MRLYVLGIDDGAGDGISVLASDRLIRSIQRALPQGLLGKGLGSRIVRLLVGVGELLLLSGPTHLLLLRVMAD